jgi:hypothetical protein
VSGDRPVLVVLLKPYNGDDARFNTLEKLRQGLPWGCEWAQDELVRIDGKISKGTIQNTKPAG